MRAFAFIVIVSAAAAGQAPAGGEPSTLRCTNPYSGATWDVAIDPKRRTADSFPADITDRSIEWRDLARGGRYEFDRASGDLTVVYASSTGGFFLKDKCRFVPAAKTG
jgi:hypothetical protein